MFSYSPKVFLFFMIGMNTIVADSEAFECGKSEENMSRVVGGEKAPSGRWPWMAAIYVHRSRLTKTIKALKLVWPKLWLKRSTFWCGGSLIGPKHILTAAHCTRNEDQTPIGASQFLVRLGDVDLSQNDEPSAPQTYQVAEIEVHPSYNHDGHYNDIAVLILDRPVTMSKFVSPVCLPPNHLSNKTFVGERSTVVGWGTTRFDRREPITIQRQATMPVWENEDCDKNYELQTITDVFICAGEREGGIDSCKGDSGGPLMLQMNGHWTEIGIVSFGRKCGEPGYPGVYTRVTKYLDWIDSRMRC